MQASLPEPQTPWKRNSLRPCWPHTTRITPFGPTRCPVFQLDRCNQYADSLTGRDNLGLELLAVALPTTTLRG